MSNIGWIGTGYMGHPMVKNLLTAGYKCGVYNRTAQKAIDLKGLGAVIESSVESICKNYDIIFIMVSDDVAFRELYNQISQVNIEGKIFVNMSTCSPKFNMEMEKDFNNKQAEFIEAPVSGSVVQAESAQLNILVGGKADIYETIKPYFLILGKEAIYLGAIGSGSNSKLAINFFLASTMESLAETISFAESKGVEREQMLKIINTGACGSPITNIKSSLIMQKNYSKVAFPIKHMLKDLKYASAAAGSNTPLIGLLVESFQKALDDGYGDYDVIGVLKNYEK